MTLEKYITWLKAHEKLIIIVLGAWLVYHVYGKAVDSWVEHDKRAISAQVTVAQAASQKVTADTAVNQQLLQQLADLKAQYATLSAQVTASGLKRQQDTNAQKKVNDTSTSSEVAQRSAELIKVQSQDIVANTDGTVTFAQSAAHTNINALEQGITDAASVLDLNKQLAACAAVDAKQDETIDQDQKTLADEKLSHVADVKLEQDKTKLAVDNGKRQFRRGFKYGFITGAVATSTVAIYLKIAKII